jgi:hypothetical protein
LELELLPPTQRAARRQRLIQKQLLRQVAGRVGLVKQEEDPPPVQPLAGGFVELNNELTGQIWKFSDIVALQEQEGSFVLRGQWPPGLYRVENKSGVELKITLLGEMHCVKAGETWRFFAHAEVGKGATLVERRL